MITPGQRRIAAHEERLVSMAAHGIGIVTSVFGPGIIYYLYRERSDFVRYHAFQALVWQGGVLVGGTAITIVTCGAGSVVFLLAGLLAGYVALRAWEGDWNGYPLMTDVGR